MKLNLKSIITAEKLLNKPFAEFDLSDEKDLKALIYSVYVVNEKVFTMNDFDRLLKLTFEPIKLRLMRDNKKYEAICERNKNNGKKGGRPKKNHKNPLGYLETQNNPEKPKKPDNDNDNDNDTVLSKDNKHDGVLKKTPSTLHSVQAILKPFKSFSCFCG